MKFHPSARRADQAFDHDHILVTLVLDEQRMSRLLDETAESVSAPGAPDQVALLAVEFLPVPVGFEARDDLADFARVVGDDRVIASFGQILGGPVERLDERALFIHDHRLFVGDLESGVAVDDIDSSTGKLFAGVLVVLLPAAAGIV